MIVSSWFPIVAINSTMLREASQNNTVKPLSHNNISIYAITVKGYFFISLCGFYLCIGRLALLLVLDVILIIDEELETRP